MRGSAALALALAMVLAVSLFPMAGNAAVRNGVPSVGQIRADSPGLETVTIVPEYGWALWSESGDLLWLVPASTEETEYLPTWGTQLWDWDDDGYSEIAVAKESESTRFVRVLDGDGSYDEPGGENGPGGSILSNSTGMILIADIDGDDNVEFVKAHVSGFVRAYDSFELAAGTQLFEIQVASTPAYATVADVTDSPGMEVVAVYDGGAKVLEYDSATETVGATSLPINGGSPPGNVMYPPTAAASAIVGAPTIASCDVTGRVYQWRDSGSGFAISSGYPQSIATACGPIGVGLWDGDPSLAIPVQDGEVTLLGQGGTAVDGFPIRVGTGVRLPWFAAADRIVMQSDPNRWAQVLRLGTLIQMTTITTVGGALPTPPIPSSVPASIDIMVTINGRILGEEVLSGDYVPSDVEINATVLDPSALERGGSLEVVALHDGLVIESHAAPSSNDRSNIEAEFTLPNGESQFRFEFGENVLKEVSLRVSDALAIEDVLAYPNPAHEAVEFTFVLSRPAEASLTVYSLSGRVAARIPKTYCREGYNHLFWDLRTATGNRVANGTYLFSIQVESDGTTKKALGRLSVAR